MCLKTRRLYAFSLIMLSSLLYACGTGVSEQHATIAPAEYRGDTYGEPDHYCDPTRSLSSAGAGTLGDPWNYAQCQSEPVAGETIGHLPVGSGVPVYLAAPDSPRTPAFNPAHSGTRENPIVHVTRYAAVSLDRASIATNPLRTELRHAGTPANLTCTNTGGPMYGSNSRDYIIYDGFFVDMAEAPFTCDSGVITARGATGVQIKNFVIQGTQTTCESNCVIWRTDNTRDTVLSNFRVYDFDNDPTGSPTTPQQGLFSALYGDQNFVIEHFEITNTDSAGIFVKGTAGDQTVFNYGTIRFGIVTNVGSCIQLNDLHASNLTTVEYVVCDRADSDGGIYLSSETTGARNLLIDHVTIARLDSSSSSLQGCVYSRVNGMGANVTIRDMLCDMAGGTFGQAVNFRDITSLPATMNYNGYYKNGSPITWSYSDSSYAAIADWQAETGRDANSHVLASDPFINRENADFRVREGHAAKAVSSSGGEIGAYATSALIGVNTNIVEARF